MPAPQPATDDRGSPLVTALATLSGLVTVVFATVVFGTVATLLGWIPPRGRVMLALGRLWARLILAATGVRVETSFETPLDKRAYVFLGNHQSYFDIPALLTVLPGQIRFAAKRSLFRIPIFGWSLYAGGFIPIDRRRREKAKDSFAVAVARLRQGCSTLFFPEGSRTWDGTIGPFERGGFLLALKSGVPIVPIGIRGAREIMPRGRYSIRPGTIRIAIGRPIDPRDYGLRGRKELIADVRRAILELAGHAEPGSGDD